MGVKIDIPEAAESELLRRAADGATSRELVAWLRSEHGVRISARALRAHWQERSARAQASVRQQVRAVLEKTRERDTARLVLLTEQLAKIGVGQTKAPTAHESADLARDMESLERKRRKCP